MLNRLYYGDNLEIMKSLLEEHPWGVYRLDLHRSSVQQQAQLQYPVRGGFKEVAERVYDGTNEILLFWGWG